MLEGADLFVAHLEGAQLNRTYVWGVKTDDVTEIGGASLHSVSFAIPSLPDLLQSLPPATPAAVTQRLAAALALPPLPSAGTPFAHAKTERGKVLLSETCQEPGFHGIACARTRTDEIGYLSDVIPI